jgi:hypothetical protein
MSSFISGCSFCLLSFLQYKHGSGLNGEINCFIMR